MMYLLLLRQGRYKTSLYARLSCQMSSDLGLESMGDSAILLPSRVGFQAPCSASSASLVPVSCGLWLYCAVSGNIADPVVGWPRSTTSSSLNSSGGEKRRS